MAIKSMGKLKASLLFFVGLLFCCASFVLAAVPGLISYQGKLTDAVGTPLGGTYTIQFKLYDAQTDGTAFWSEEQNVAVSDGIYNIHLGAVNSLDLTAFPDAAMYLEVIIYNPETTSWELLSPRQRVTSTAYAFQAQNAETLAGQGSADFAPVEHNHSADDFTSGLMDESLIDPDIARDAEIAWSNLMGIPADIADGDQTGISVETDPTVIASVKDGVSWSELSGIPSGFADGVDNTGGDIDAVTAGIGLSGGGTSGSVTLDVDIPFSLTASDSNGLIRAYNSNATGIGGYFEATGTGGRGVYGYASNWAGGTSSGGWFISNGQYGRGVYAKAINDDFGPCYGGYFETVGNDSVAVYGKATATVSTHNNWGGYFEATSPSGRGVQAKASGTYGTGVVAYGGSNGKGVHANGGEWDFYAGGSGQDYGSNSSIRWKQNIQEINGALELIMQMRGVYFDWDEDHGGRHDMGFIAEEVGQHIPEIVSFEEDGYYANALDYGKMTPILLQAIKEQQEIISGLRVEIEKLKAKIDTINADR